MAYQATLINRLEQYGQVCFDLTVVDDAGILPALRSAVSLPSAQDRAAVRLALRQVAVLAATADQQPAARKARLQAMRDAAEDARREALARRDALQDALDRNDY